MSIGGSRREPPHRARGILPVLMPEESTTPDLVEVAREVFEAASRRDVDAMMSGYAPDAVWEAHPLGEAFEGAEAIRGFLEGWFSSYEAYQTMPEEILD